MTSQVFPISSAQTTTGQNTPKPPDNNLGQDTFLKLLVAQLKYQDPMSPADSTQFLTQTAQFTQLETLQKIETEQQALSLSTQVLSASSMVGRPVTYSLASLNGGTAKAPTATSVVSLRGSLPKDAAAGAVATANTSVYTNTGTKIPLTLRFTKGIDGWSVQTYSGSQALGSATSIGFDATGDHTNNDVLIPASALNAITGTSGSWPPGGITLGFGDSTDPTRLQLLSGPATVAVAEQNGNDGNTATGVVTGIHMTTDGPQLVIGGQNIPLNSVSDVNQ